MAVNRFPIEAGHVLTFVRAIGDTNPAYADRAFDETGLLGVAVPPTFVQSAAQFDADYPLRPHPDRPWLGAAGGGGERSGRDSEAQAPTLHAEQRYEFTRPVRVGDVLSAVQRPGRSWEKARRGGGRLAFSESVTEFRDRDGKPVVTATAVAVRVEPADRGEAER